VLKTPHELFDLRLRTQLWVERRLADELLPLFREHVHSTQLKYAIDHHMFETLVHARTLERILHLRGAAGEPVESPALLGLKADHDALMQLIDQERDDVVDLMHAEVLAATEHHEIAVYASLVATANALGEDGVAAQLQEIREQEEHALEVVERATVELLAEKVEGLRLDA
jgi:ferritin-like metal-binding protein YciE